MKNALILFVRHPELGKVKTRLAKDIGEQAALNIYVQLLQHTHDITCALDCDKFVFYTDEIIENDIWEEACYLKRKQCAGDLGERMKYAFDELFHVGYNKVIIIGSDCPGLSSGFIITAFEVLNEMDAVLGPAADGGYYLLGLTKMEEGIFKCKQWSTDSVLEDTICDLNNFGLRYFLLPALHDVDTKNDLDKLNKAFPGRKLW